MAIIKKFSPLQNLSGFQVFINDTAPNSQYFKITEFAETFTGGKNGFLIEGSEFLRETTEVKIEILDVENQPIYYEPGNGIPEYYEGTSKLVSVHVYDDTPIGTAKITILGELKNYIDENGAVVPVPAEWRNIYNVKWQKTFQVNKNISNETRVRFYKRPSVSISELVKPIFSKSVPSVTDTGTATGEAILPSAGTPITNYRAGTSYRLTRSDGVWDKDVDENQITFSGLGYSSRIIEVLNDKQVLVDVPYTTGSLVDNFVSQSYSVTYSDFQNEIIGESTLTGSFAKIDITQLKTFVGDVARVKVFRKSRNEVSDFQFVQESKLESSELLRDITTNTDTELSYGLFDEYNLSNYWITSSTDHPTTIDSSVLSQAVKVDYAGSGVQQLITSESFSISKDVEYTLNFRTLLSGSLDDTNKSVRAFFSSSNFTQDFVTVSGSAIYRTRQNVSQNILSENTGDAHLVFEFTGDDWYISNVSLKNAQDTSFSPDEFTLIQDVPRKLASETFDFRFEFYDINNNYIPVDVAAVGVFDGGNDFPTSGKLLTFESDRNAFRFSSGSIANPAFQQIQFKVTQNNLTGSITFASQAYDVDGNYIDPSSYSGTYPGTLTSITPAGAILRIADFSGSDDSVIVGSIIYTASLESLQEFETVYRLEDGDNAPQLIVTSNANQFIYEPTALEPKPSGQSITIRAQRKNLASLITPLTINKSDSNGPDLTYVDTVGGIDTYTLSATAFSQSFSANSFDEITYQFTGSDVFGNEQYDEITISKVINFDGVSITLSNESTTFRANGQGLVLDTFDSGDGNVEVRIGNKIIEHDNGLTVPNRFDITGSVPTNVTEKDASYTSDEYGITALTQDSGSIILNIKYLAGDGVTTQSFNKKVNYTKNRIAQPSITFDTSNKTQNVDAKSTGEQLTDFDDSVLTIREFYTGSVTTFTSSDITSLVITSGSNDSSGNPLVTRSGLTLSFGDLPNGVNSTQIGLTATLTDSEGFSREVSDTISLSKTLASAPNVEFQVTPSAQTLTSNSVGGSTSSATNLVVTANEGGSTRTISFPSAPTANNGVTITSYTAATGVIVLNTSAMSADTSTITISARATNTEGTDVTKTLTATVSKAKTAQPSITFTATPQAQTIDAKSTGVLVGSITDVVIDGFQGNSALTYNQAATLGVSEYKITNVTGVTVADTTPSTSTIDITAFSGDSATGTASISYKDSEGTSGTSTIKFSLSKSKAATPVVLVSATPQTQNTTANSSGVQTGTFNNVVVSVSNGTFVSMTKTQSGFSTNPTITTGSNTLTMSSAVITTANTSASVTLTVNYTDSEGTSGSQNIVITVTKSNDGEKGDDGDPGENGLRTGQGLIHYQVTSATAPSTPSATSYTFSNGTFSGLTANWGIGAPTYAAGNSNKYWYSTYTVVETTSGGGTGVPSFSAPTQAIGFTGLVSFTASETVGDGTNNLSFGLAGTTLINGDNISTGRIISTNWDGPDSGEEFADAGMEIDLDNGKITAKQFLIDGSGNAKFKGDVTGATGTFSGTVTIGGTALTANNTLNSNTTSTDVGLGNVQNLNAQNQAQSGLISGTTITGGGITLSGGGSIKGGQTDYNTGTGFFLGYSGGYKFSIGNASTKGITWDGSNLTIGGGVTIGATLASTVVSGAAAGANAIPSGQAASDITSNNTTITGGNISTGNIQSSGYNAPGGITNGSTFSTSGMNISLDNGSVTAPRFRINTDGDAFFSGLVSGSSIQGGNISIGGGNFTVDSDGVLTATDANISGIINSNQATLGSWTVDEDSITAKNGDITLNATDGYIYLKDNGSTKVNLNTNSTLTTPGAGGNFGPTSYNAAYKSDSATLSVVGQGSGGNTTYQNVTSFTTPAADSNWSIAYSYTNGTNTSVSAAGLGSQSGLSVYIEVRSGGYSGTVLKSSLIQSVYAYGYDDEGFSVEQHTDILLDGGITKQAKDVKTNDVLLVWDETTNSFVKTTASKIRRKTGNVLYEVVVGEHTILVSDSHGFWLDGGLEIKVQDIVEGETKIYVKNDNNIELLIVDKVTRIEGDEKVFITFEIPIYHNYVSNNIISHNPIGGGFPLTDTQYFANSTGTLSFSASASTTYYLTLKYVWSYYLYGSTYTSSRIASYVANFDGNYSGNSLNAGTEINNAGLQVLSGKTRVFRADTNAGVNTAWMYQIGGTYVDYFIPKYSHQTYGEYEYGDTGNTNIGYNKKSFPVTRAMCMFDCNSVGTPTLRTPYLNVSTVTRSSIGVYVVTLNEGLGAGKGIPIISSYGRAGDSPSYIPTDAEFTSNMGAKHNTVTDSYTLGFKDNDRNDNDDPYTVYFVVFG